VRRAATSPLVQSVLVVDTSKGYVKPRFSW
jgi:hypothetical protein